MSDEPSARAQWTVKTAVNIGILLAYLGLLLAGILHDSLTVKEALALLGSTALGGGIGWFAK